MMLMMNSGHELFKEALGLVFARCKRKKGNFGDVVFYTRSPLGADVVFLGLEFAGRHVSVLPAPM